MGEVISRHTVAFQKHFVDDIFGEFNLPADNIVKMHAAVFVAVGAKTQNIRFARAEIRFYLFVGKVAAFRIFPEVPANERAVFFLLLAKGGKLVRRAETRIGKAAAHQIFRHDMINFDTFALGIGPVSARFAVKAGHAFVRRDAERPKPLENSGNTVFNFTFFIGIFNPKIKHAVGRFCGHIIRQRAEKPADMQIAGGARRKPRDARPFGKRTGRVFFFQVLRHSRNLRKQQVGNFLSVRHLLKHLTNTDILLYYRRKPRKYQLFFSDIENFAVQKHGICKFSENEQNHRKG